jgi:hypothetical protein
MATGLLPRQATTERAAVLPLGLTALKSLNLDYCGAVTDAGLEHIKGLTNLERRACGGVLVPEVGSKKSVPLFSGKAEGRFGRLTAQGVAWSTTTIHGGERSGLLTIAPGATLASKPGSASGAYTYPLIRLIGNTRVSSGNRLGS